MSIWNKVLIGLIIVASLAFFYMSARMLKTQKYWGHLAEQYEAAIDKLQTENQHLKAGETIGGEFKPGIEQVRAELDKLIVDRHRVWYDCNPTVNVNPQTGAATIKVTVDQPDPHGIAVNTMLYAFEDAGGQQKGRYLGEFKAAAVADKQVTLEPAFRLLPRDAEKLSAANKRPWTLYDAMPHDNHGIFARLSTEEKKALLPADSVEQYLADGQPAAEGQPAQRIVDGKYVRELRDYDYLFDAYRLKITVLIDLDQAAMRDLQMLADTQADAKRQVQFYQHQVTVFQALLEKLARQRDTVKAYLDNLQEKLSAAKTAVQNLIKENKAMAGQIAQIQLEATRRIDQRTRAMAQSTNRE